MPTVRARFYAELNDSLPPQRKMRDDDLDLGPGATVHDLLAAAGVTEDAVDLVLVNGESSGAHRVLNNGDRVSIYPVFESLDIHGVSRMHPAPLRVQRFVLDTHLGKLASYLRMLGFDTLYRNDFTDEELVRLSWRESRLLLSRDRMLINSPGLQRAYLVRATDPAVQIREVVERFDLGSSMRPFTRCMQCNTPLRPVSRDEIADRLPLRVRQQPHEFLSCAGCSRIYWKGTHYARMKEFVDSLLQNAHPSEQA